MENVISEWLRCPVCGNKTRLKIRGDTELKYFPLFCPKCRQETLSSHKTRLSRMAGNATTHGWPGKSSVADADMRWLP